MSWGDPLSFESNDIVFLHPGRWIITGFAVDGYATLLDKGIAGAAGTDPTRCQELIQSGAFRHGMSEDREGGTIRFRLRQIRKMKGIEEYVVLVLRLGFWKADGTLAFLPLAAFLEEFDAFKALKDRALAGGATADFQAVVLGHGVGVDWMGAGR